MNTQSNTLPESGFESRVAAPVDISPVRRMYWLIRRELWENRSIYIAPLAAAGLILFGFLISTVHLRDTMRAALAVDATQGHDAIRQPYNFAELMLMGTFLVVAIFYCLDALHGAGRRRHQVELARAGWQAVEPLRELLGDVAGGKAALLEPRLVHHRRQKG